MQWLIQWNPPGQLVTSHMCKYVHTREEGPDFHHCVFTDCRSLTEWAGERLHPLSTSHKLPIQCLNVVMWIELRRLDDKRIDGPNPICHNVATHDAVEMNAFASFD